VSAGDVSELLRTLDEPPSARSVAVLRRIADASPRFLQARESLGWTLLKLGEYVEAGAMFRGLLGEKLGAADRASVMLGLGCVAHAQTREDAPARGGATARSRPAAAAAANGSVFSGLLSAFSVPDLLEFVRGARRTGELVCSAGNRAATLRFRDGWITGVSPPGGQPADGGTADFGERVEAALRELVQWTDGSFAFRRDDGGDEPGAESGGIDVQRALLNVFRQMDEDARDETEAPGAAPA
jgi:hypothetical protein